MNICQLEENQCIKKKDGFFSFLRSSSPKPKQPGAPLNKKSAKVITAKHNTTPLRRERTPTKRPTPQKAKRSKTPPPLPSRPGRRHSRENRDKRSSNSPRDDSSKSIAENSHSTSRTGANRMSRKKDTSSTDDIPVISNWERNADGCITGNISNAHDYEDGMVITTAPVTGRIIITDSGHKYRLI